MFAYANINGVARCRDSSSNSMYHINNQCMEMYPRTTYRKMVKYPSSEKSQKNSQENSHILENGLVPPCPILLVVYRKIHVDAISKVYLHKTTKEIQLWAVFGQILFGRSIKLPAVFFGICMELARYPDTTSICFRFSFRVGYRTIFIFLIFILQATK